uniref:Protein pelota homolog n=1 Tax=Hirondellea gigas TaxID=1518452 RepID=A0A6A7G9S5_9CRUS
MKQLSRKIEKDGGGSIRLMPEHSEDMWHVFNLLAEGDHISSVSFRKVQKSNNPTGSSVTQRVKIKVTLIIENIAFDSIASKIRISGKNTVENRHIKLGQYHTIELAENRPFTLSKSCWDAIYLERVKMATDVAQSAELAAIVMQQGLAHLLLITPYMTITKTRIEVPIPRKRTGSSTRHDKGVTKFFETILDAIIQSVDFDIVKCCIIASPGFFKDDFAEWMFAEALKKDISKISGNKDKFLLCHSSSGHKQALNEVLQDPLVVAKLENTKATDEVRILDRFLRLLNTDPDRAYYGYGHVTKANELNAIDTLLVTDDLFRSADIKSRRQYVNLVESVKENSGNVAIFSVLHVSGEQLRELTGCAAILRFPLPDLDHDDESDSNDEDEQKSD